MAEPRGGETRRSRISSRGGSEYASGRASESSGSSARSVCGATRIERVGVGASSTVRRGAAASSSSGASPKRLCGSISLINGPVISVVTSAITTSAVNSAGVITPASSARLSTISSVRPRVFIIAPSAAELRHGRFISRAATSVPPNLPTIATAISPSVIRISDGRPEQPDVGAKARVGEEQREQQRQHEVLDALGHLVGKPGVARHDHAHHEPAEDHRHADLVGDHRREQHAGEDDRDPRAGDASRLVVGDRRPAEQPADQHPA